MSEDFQQEHEDQPIYRHPAPARATGLWVGLAALCVISAVSVAGFFRARNQARDADAGRARLTESLNQAQSQIQALTSRIDALTAAEQAREAAAQQAPASATARHSPSRAAGARVRPAAQRPREDPRWHKMESQLAEQQQQLAKTREDLSKAQSDLQSRLSTTRDELNTSIARTHEQVVALEKRGERNYYEFDLEKSKQMQRVGPISLALRKANTKHGYYDMQMLVDDIKLDKKHVNLYEPVWINLADRPQPVELVVNQITKDHVRGYISEPKYRKSELSATAAGAPGAAPQPQLQSR